MQKPRNEAIIQDRTEQWLIEQAERFANLSIEMKIS